MTEPASTPNQRRQLLDRLYAQFPVFRDFQPLAIGIHKSLLERLPDLDKAAVRAALHFHTASTRYLKAIVQGAPRFDLDGNASGEVTPEQQTQAVTALRERFRKAAERRKAEEEARERQEKIEKLAQKFNSR